MMASVSLTRATRLGAALLLAACAGVSLSVRADDHKVKAKREGGEKRGGDLRASLRALPASERKAWEKYFEISSALRRKDEKVLEEEMKREDRSKALTPKSGDPFRVPRRPPEWFGSKEARTIAKNVISFQSPSGGWTKNMNMTKRPRRRAERWSPWAPWRYVATIDNGATTGQILFLAKVHEATGDEACRAAVLRGLNWLLTAQTPSGGWPQVFPLQGGYHDSVTFNDDAMAHVLELLRDASRRRTPFKFLDDETVRRCRRAVQRGVECVLKAQIRVSGRRAAWCAQHHPVTLAPVMARAYEKPSISGSESVGIIRFLMSLDQPSPEVIQAVDDAVAWFQASRIRPEDYGMRAGPPGWARFYDLETNRPIFSDKDGKIHESWSDLKSKRGGYSWFTRAPQPLLEREYPAWRKKVAKAGRG